MAYLIEPSDADLGDTPNSVREYIRQLEIRVDELTERQTKEDLESVSDVLTRVMEKNKIENFTANVFSIGDRNVEIICRYVDGKSTTDLLTELRQQVDQLSAENERLKKDLQFFIDQSVIIEHKQDHETMRKLREKYESEW